MSREERMQVIAMVHQTAPPKTPDISTGPYRDAIYARQIDALDAYDAANGVHRVCLDEGTVERASEVLLQDRDWCECRRSPFDKHDVNPPCSTRMLARKTARLVLAAAVKED